MFTYIKLCLWLDCLLIATAVIMPAAHNNAQQAEFLWKQTNQNNLKVSFLLHSELQHSWHVQFSTPPTVVKGCVAVSVTWKCCSVLLLLPGRHLEVRVLCMALWGSAGSCAESSGESRYECVVLFETNRLERNFRCNISGHICCCILSLHKCLVEIATEASSKTLYKYNAVRFSSRSCLVLIMFEFCCFFCLFVCFWAFCDGRDSLQTLNLREMTWPTPPLSTTTGLRHLIPVTESPAKS